MSRRLDGPDGGPPPPPSAPPPYPPGLAPPKAVFDLGLMVVIVLSVIAAVILLPAFLRRGVYSYNASRRGRGTSAAVRRRRRARLRAAGLAAGLPPGAVVIDLTADGSSPERGYRAESHRLQALRERRRVHVHNDGDLDEDDSGGAATKECSICMEAYETGQMVQTLACRHSFHEACIDKWLFEVQAHRPRWCPLCRADPCASVIPTSSQARRQPGASPTGAEDSEADVSV